MAGPSIKQVKFLTALASIGYHTTKRVAKTTKWLVTTKPGHYASTALVGGALAAHLTNKIHYTLRSQASQYTDPRRPRDR